MTLSSCNRNCEHTPSAEMDNIHKFAAVLVALCVLLVQVTAQDSPADSAKFTFPTIPGFASKKANPESRSLKVGPLLSNMQSHYSTDWWALCFFC